MERTKWYQTREKRKQSLSNESRHSIKSLQGHKITQHE